jgi:hypothetical protein
MDLMTSVSLNWYEHRLLARLAKATARPRAIDASHRRFHPVKSLPPEV